MNSNTAFAQEFARTIDGASFDSENHSWPVPIPRPPTPTAEVFAVRKAKVIAEHEAAKAEMLEMRARVAIAIEKAETPADQIAAAEDVPLVLNKTTGRWTMAPYIEVPMSMVFPEISPDWMLKNKIFQQRTTAPC
jgi:hypothetical protein